MSFCLFLVLSLSLFLIWNASAFVLWWVAESEFVSGGVLQVAVKELSEIGDWDGELELSLLMGGSVVDVGVELGEGRRVGINSD
jgi:hypothetical protein